MPTKYLSTISIALSCIALSACSSYDDTHDHPNLTSGKQLYNRHCVDCHGKDGTGLLADRTPASILTHKSRDGIADYIRKGGQQGRNMPVFKNMSAAEASKIASHLLSLKQTYNSLSDKERKNPQLLIEP